jgi:DNA-binding Lrp family transcriptional regulator
MKKSWLRLGIFYRNYLNKDQDSDRIIEELKIPEITECYYITGSFTLYIKSLLRSRTHAKVLYEKLILFPVPKLIRLLLKLLPLKEMWVFNIIYHLMKHLKSYLILIVFSISSLFYSKITTAEIVRLQKTCQQVTRDNWELHM